MLNRLRVSGWAWLWVTLVVILLDRISKHWVITHLDFFESLRLLPFLNFTLAYNTGAAFSFFDSGSGWQNILLGSLAMIVGVIVLAWLKKLSRAERFICISLCLILGGALGNVLDRLLYSHVIDFIDFHLSDWHFAIFNIADASICVGSFMLMAHWIIYPKWKAWKVH